MSFQKTKIARSIGVILAASSCAFSAFAGPVPQPPQEPYCSQSAQEDPLLKFFEITKEQLETILREGKSWECFQGVTSTGSNQCSLTVNGEPLTGQDLCMGFLEEAIHKLDDEVVGKFLGQMESMRVRDAMDLESMEPIGSEGSVPGKEFAKLALADTKKTVSCGEVKGLLKTIIHPYYEDSSEDSFPSGNLRILPSVPTIVKGMCSASGMGQGQGNEMQKNVRGAIAPVNKAFNGEGGSGAAPSPSSGGMGKFASQTQGQSSQTSGTGSSSATGTSTNGNSQNINQSPLTKETKTPPVAPPSPESPSTSAPAKSKPGFFAKIWNGIKKVGHYIISSRIGTGLMLGLAAGLMVTGFGAAPGVIIAAAVLGAGIGLAAGPLTKSSASKALPPPPPIASSPTNSQNPSPTPTTPSPNPPAAPAATTPPGENINLNPNETMKDANATAQSLNQNKPTENDTVPGPDAPAATARNTTQNSRASKTHPRNPGQHSNTHGVPSSPAKSAKAKSPKVPIPIAKSAVEGAVVGGGLGWGLAAAGIISAPVWASAALGVAAGAAVVAAGAAAWNYFKDKPAPAKPVKPQKNQNPGNPPKTQALPKPPTPASYPGA